MRANNEKPIITNRENIINTLIYYAFDLRSCLLEIISNNDFKKTTETIMESSLYWIGKLVYKDDYGKIRKLTEDEYKKYLFSKEFRNDTYLNNEFKEAKSISVKKYYMFCNIFSHILSLENIFLDAPEYGMLIDTIPKQKDIIKPKYKGKKSIYPCNMPDMKFDELLEFRKI